MTYRDQLLEQLSTGPKRPSDLDEALLGEMFIPGLIGKLPPYADELGALINEGIVNWSRADNDIVWYEKTL